MLNWQSLDPLRTELAIQALLRRMYPGMRAFDGSGGDGGRDAELVTADGRTVFEVKSHGRLGSSQKRQIQRSLATAVESVPDMARWVLVIPMNMTPSRGGRSGEQAWFEGKLQALAPGVTLDWWGLDWLDGQAAANPDFVRYLEGADSQVLERARAFKMEQEVLAGGVRDLHARLQGLRGVVDDISMFWTLDFATAGGVTTSKLRAKFPEAHKLDPITITPTFAFAKGDSEAEQLRERFVHTMGFGGSVDLPAGYVTGFDVDASAEARMLFPDDDPADAEWTIATVRERLDRNLRCSYQVVDAEDRVLGEFAVFFRERTAGSRGVTLFGSDAAGIAEIEASLPRPAHVPSTGEAVVLEGARLELTMPDSLVGFDVDSLAPIINTLAAAVQGTRIRLTLPGLGVVSSSLLAAAQHPGAAATSSLVADLQRMQRHTGSLLRLPDNITKRDVRDLRDFVRLLDGESVIHDGGFELSLKPEAVGEFLELLANSEGGTAGAFMSMTDGLEIQVGDLTLPYGHAAFYAPLPRLINESELRAFVASDADRDGPIEARFEPTSEPFRWMPQQLAADYYEAAPESSSADDRGTHA